MTYLGWYFIWIQFHTRDFPRATSGHQQSCLSSLHVPRSDSGTMNIALVSACSKSSSLWFPSLWFIDHLSGIFYNLDLIYEYSTSCKRKLRCHSFSELAQGLMKMHSPTLTINFAVEWRHRVTLGFKSIFELLWIQVFFSFFCSCEGFRKVVRTWITTQVLV